jgi:hypothetical protein
MPRPDRFTHRKETWYRLYRRLGGPQGRSGQVRKMSALLGFDPWTVQSVASRYTNYLPYYLILISHYILAVRLRLSH